MQKKPKPMTIEVTQLTCLYDQMGLCHYDPFQIASPYSKGKQTGEVPPPPLFYHPSHFGRLPCPTPLPHHHFLVYLPIHKTNAPTSLVGFLLLLALPLLFTSFHSLILFLVRNVLYLVFCLVWACSNML